MRKNHNVPRRLGWAIALRRIITPAFCGVLAFLPVGCGNTPNGPVTNYYTNPTTPPNFGATAYSFTTQWGTPTGTGDGKLSGPLGMAVQGSIIMVVDNGNNRVQEFSVTGEYMDQWNSGTGGAFNNPFGVATDGAGDIFVADYGNNLIQKLDSTGAPVTAWHNGNGGVTLKQPNDLVLDGSGNIYVADTGNNRVQKLDSTGAPVTAWTSGSGGGFVLPAGVALDRLGNIYVANNNLIVDKLSAVGAPVTSWGGAGSGNGKFSQPFGVAVDNSNYVYITDVGNNLVQKFDSNGKFITQWGGSGNGNGAFNSPYGIAVDSLGNVYVADSGNNVIQKFAPLP